MVSKEKDRLVEKRKITVAGGGETGESGAIVETDRRQAKSKGLTFTLPNNKY